MEEGTKVIFNLRSLYVVLDRSLERWVFVLSIVKHGTRTEAEDSIYKNSGLLPYCLPEGASYSAFLQHGDHNTRTYPRYSKYSIQRGHYGPIHSIILMGLARGLVLARPSPRRILRSLCIGPSLLVPTCFAIDFVRRLAYACP